jgi:outer membrane receptor protein involved in Fe transport
MFTALLARRLVASVSAVSLLGVATPTVAGAVGPLLVEELVVTAERREQSIQDAPVAVSAFTDDMLRAQRLDGGQNLLQAVPNVNFSRANFGGFNFGIRGIGTEALGTSSDSGVSIHVNGSPVTNTRLADTEFYDIDRVEVLRGPQGTLYGRNATGGVVNIITARPGPVFGGYVTADYGNYDTRRVQAAINIPLTTAMSLRWAAFGLKRDGYGTNTFTGHDVDNRHLSSSRLSFRLQHEALDVTAQWEHFSEKDNRSRVGKQLCVNDPGPTTLGAVPVSAANRGLLSQGCLPGSRYQDAAYGAANSSASLGGLLAQVSGLSTMGDLNAGKMQDHNLRNVESAVDPIYAAKEDFFQIDAQLRISDSLTFNALTSFNDNSGYSFQDFNRVIPTGVFTPAGPAAVLFPGGFVDDPQVGRANTLRQFDRYDSDSREFTQEFRLSSNSGGPLDFSAGAIHINYRIAANYYTFSNALTGYALITDAAAGNAGVSPFYVDRNLPPTGDGHSYFDARTFNRIRSDAVFGEVYWNLRPDLKLTAGARYTRDRKQSDFLPVTLLAMPTRVAAPPASGLIPNPAFNGGRGFPAAGQMSKSGAATTGRLNLEWSPKVAFTDSSMLYLSYARGYKGGGFNTPCDSQSPGCGLAAPTFEPEHVTAYEIGSKNVLAGRRLVLNATAFIYDYDGYQVSAIINKAAQNVNLGAKIHGAEVEGVWEPVHDLRFNLAAGWLRTRIGMGSSIDTLDRTQGNSALAVIKGSDASNCVVNRAALAQLVAIYQGLPGAPRVPGITGAPTALLGACSGLYSALGLYNYAGQNVSTAPVFVNGAPGPNTTVQIGQGVPVSLTGKRLPNAPSWTIAFGAQYGWRPMEGWRVVLRGDYYRQAASYARIFNTGSDRLKGYQNLNATLTLSRPMQGLEVQLYGKNLTDEAPITDLYLADESAGLFTNTFTLEPRQYGISLTKRF